MMDTLHEADFQEQPQQPPCCPSMHWGYFTVLVALGFAPCVAVLIGLWAADSIILAFFLFHYVVALGIPILLLCTVKFFKDYRDKVKFSLIIKPNSKIALCIGAIVFVICSGGLVLLFYFASPSIDQVYIRQAIQDFGIEPNDIGIIVFFFIYFNVVNPLIEEFFWRRFLLKGFPNAESYRWLDSLMYGSYHMFVIAKFTNWIFGFVVACLLIFVGRAFIFLQEWKDGFVGLMAHVGGDLGISFILFGVLYEWY